MMCCAANSDEERAKMALFLICEMTDVDTFDEQCECITFLAKMIKKLTK